MYTKHTTVAHFHDHCALKTQHFIVCVCVCVCVVVTELHVTVGYIKILSFAQKCHNGKLLSQATMQNYRYQFLKEIIFQLIFTWPSLDIQFEQADHSGSHCIVSLFL